MTIKQLIFCGIVFVWLCFAAWGVLLESQVEPAYDEKGFLIGYKDKPHNGANIPFLIWLFSSPFLGIAGGCLL